MSFVVFARVWIHEMIAVGAIACVATACLRFEEYRCEDASDCNAHAEGRCEQGGSCSYADPECDSGRRWSEHALKSAGACVDVDSGETGTTTSVADVESSSGEGSSTTDKSAAP
jgi:hypothetical protein